MVLCRGDRGAGLLPLQRTQRRALSSVLLVVKWDIRGQQGLLRGSAWPAGVPGPQVLPGFPWRWWPCSLLLLEAELVNSFLTGCAQESCGPGTEQRGLRGSP